MNDTVIRERYVKTMRLRLRMDTEKIYMIRVNILFVDFSYEFVKNNNIGDKFTMERPLKNEKNAIQKSNSFKKFRKHSRKSISNL